MLYSITLDLAPDADLWRAGEAVSDQEGHGDGICRAATTGVLGV